MAAAGAAGLEGAADGGPHGPAQAGQLVGVEVDPAAARVDPGPPQGLVGQQVAHPGQRLLVEQAGLDRGPAAADQVPEALQRDLEGVRAQPPAGRVEGDPAEAPRVAQDHGAAVGEGEREPLEARLRVVEAQAPAHAKVQAEHRPVGLDQQLLAHPVDPGDPVADEGLA